MHPNEYRELHQCWIHNGSPNDQKPLSKQMSIYLTQRSPQNYGLTRGPMS